MADEKKPKKYAGKFDSDAELEKAYQELESKLGKQGEELGLTKKQIEEAQRAMEQYAAHVQQLSPYAQWYQTNQNSLQLYNQWLQSGGQTPHPNAQPAAAAQNQNSIVNLLTPEEKQALYKEFVSNFDTGVFKPWQQNFAQQLDRLANERAQGVLESVNKNQRAFTEVLWRTMQHGLPEERVAAMREWHNKALELGDPTKFDPMKAADDYLSVQRRLSDFESKEKAWETEREKLQRDSMPALAGGRGANSDWLKPAEEAPKTKFDRMEAVFNETTEKVGRDAFKEAFGAGR